MRGLQWRLTQTATWHAQETQRPFVVVRAESHIMSRLVILSILGKDLLNRMQANINFSSVALSLLSSLVKPK